MILKTIIDTVVPKVKANHRVCKPQDWTEGTFPRDTLIHSLGSLSVVVLQGAFGDLEVAAAYRTWMGRMKREPALKDSGEHLLTTGTGEGRLTLVARGKLNEFCLLFEHSAFHALVAIGFDVRSQRLSGMCVAKFKGDIGAAIQFARTLEARIQARTRLGPAMVGAPRSLSN